MLHLLVDFLSGIIRILAAACVVAGTVYGYVQAPVMQVEPWVGGLIGFSAGFLVASLAGGLFACFILIENHLRVLADAQRRMDKAKPAQNTAGEKETPADTQEPEPATTDYRSYRRAYSYQPRPVPLANTDSSRTDSEKSEKAESK